MRLPEPKNEGQSTVSSREQCWEALYDRLLEALVPFGRNDALGDDDYWLIDDDCGGKHHKICVAHPDFWTDAVHAKVRHALENDFRDWGVYVVFEETSKRPGEMSRRQGFIVYADRDEFEPRED